VVQQRSHLRRPVVQRSRMMLEVASELVAAQGWDDKQVEIRMRPQGAPEWGMCFFASDAPNSIDAVANGEAQFAICNPGGVLAMALKGAGPFKQAVPVRAISVFPQFDPMGLAVTALSGLTSLAEIRDLRFPLKVSLRGQRDHSVHLVTDQIFRAMGFSLDDITAWGGHVRYDEAVPSPSGRLALVKSGEVDAIFDEALPVWCNPALEMGMRFLPIEEPYLTQLEQMGLPRNPITREEYPRLPVDVPAIDFSGWPVFTLESTPDAVVTAFCAALEARKDRIPLLGGEGPMPLARMVQNTPEAPLTIPLHPAAERFWKGQGYLR
jgi:TRAP-type uncharacterized transport system substrate-binding protein